MALTLNGSSNVITGLAVGGLPDGIVDEDMLAANAVATAKIPDDAITAPKFGTKSYVSCALIADKKAASTDGGTATGGGHYQRDLNHEFYDPDGIVSISSNDFTLANAGTYIIEWSAPAGVVQQHVSRLRQTSPSDTGIQEGTCEFSSSSDQIITRSTGSARVTTAGSTTYRIMHRVNTTKSSNGFGIQCNGNGSYDVYTWVKIYKEA